MEIVCRSEAYRRFESSSLRQIKKTFGIVFGGLFLFLVRVALPTFDFLAYCTLIKPVKISGLW